MLPIAPVPFLNPMEDTTTASDSADRNTDHGKSDEPVYVISVAARLTNLPAWFLRVLDDEGIVVPVRTDSSRRLYSARDLARLARVRYLTEERKVNIAGVRVIFEMEAGLRGEPTYRAQPPAAEPAPAPTAMRDVLALLPSYSKPDGE